MTRRSQWSRGRVTQDPGGPDKTLELDPKDMSNFSSKVMCVCGARFSRASSDVPGSRQGPDHGMPTLLSSALQGSR